MSKDNFKWTTLYKKDKKLDADQIISLLLKNRGLNKKLDRKNFLNPKKPWEYNLTELKVSKKNLSNAIKRIKRAIENKEDIVIFGDYDSDGICATAVLWEFLYSFSNNVIPYLPDRFSEGYGINAESISKLKSQNSKLKLIITVDNGIVASKAVKKANELGIDVIITDHHRKEKILPKAYSIIYTPETSGAGIAWLFAMEICRAFKLKNIELLKNSLELSAIGVISDQVPLLGVNRSIVKYGLEKLNSTKRPGLMALFKEAGLGGRLYKNKTSGIKQIGTYEVNFIIAPRLNAMGRLERAIDSLRLLCTKNFQKAIILADLLGKTNRERQRVVDETILHARNQVIRSKKNSVIIIAHESYHEGIIGLVASKLVEEFYLPAIVLSKGKDISKASARSIAGFDIIRTVRKLGSLIEGGGGHPMAAGFSLKTSNIKAFINKFENISHPLLTKEVIQKKLKVDMEINFDEISLNLLNSLKNLEPFGVGNPQPVFITQKVKILDLRMVGNEGKHLKMKLEKENIIFDAIGFGISEKHTNLGKGSLIDLVYNIDENIWNGYKNLQLKLKDLHFS